MDVEDRQHAAVAQVTVVDVSGPQIFVSVRPPNSSYEQQVDSSQLVRTFAFEETETKANKLDITIDNYDLSQSESSLWQAGNKVVFSFGYPGAMSVQREMTIQKVKGFNPIKVECHGDESLMNRRPRSDRHWENMKRSDVIRQIAKEYGFTGNLAQIQETPEVQKQITQGAMTDLQLVKSLAWREGFTFFIDWDGFHWHKRDLKQRPLQTFEYFNDPALNQIWGIDIEVDSAPGKPGAVALSGRDADKKISFKVTAGDANNADRTTLAATRTGYGTFEKIDAQSNTSSEAAFAAPSVAQDHSGPTTEKSKDAAQKTANGQYQEQQGRAVTITFTAIGDPLTMKASIITLKGLGTKYSGNYHITTIKHTPQPGGGYNMTIKAKSDGHGGGGGGGPIPSTALPTDASQNKGAPADPTQMKEVIDAETNTSGYKNTGGRGQ